MKYLQLLLVSFILMVPVFSIGQSINIYLEEIEIPELGGIQSYAFGHSNGKYLILGGRLDGLHRRQPWASFDMAGHNDRLLVIDPESEELWYADMNALNSELAEQLRSTNMEFYQDGNVLYCLGGYGYSSAIDDHTTFDALIAIDVAGLINAIINEEDISSFFRTIRGPEFQVAGGRLRKIYDSYYLLGGQKFIGLYNPHGPDHGPGFTQEYTNAVRIFKIHDDGDILSIEQLGSYIDSLNLHRRDYNAEAQIMPDGQEAITMFSGVFQYDVDLPYLNSVNVDSSGYSVNDNFNQYYNHYHCPTLPLYSDTNKEMHTIFFGGIAQFYEDNGILVQDNDVPFVKTIARVSRDHLGNMAEYKLPVEMPQLLGAGAEFMIREDVASYANGVVKMDELENGKQLIGYIFGGIASSQENIFWINDGSQSQASSKILKVYVEKDQANSIHTLNEHSVSPLQMNIFPNPTINDFSIEFNLDYKSDVTISILKTDGELVQRTKFEDLGTGKVIINQRLDHNSFENAYIIKLSTHSETVSKKVIITD